MNAVQIHKRDEEEAKWGGGFWLCDTSLVNNGSTSAEEISNTRKSAMSSTHKWMSFNDIWWMRSCGMDDVSKAPSSAAAVELLLASFVLSHSKLRMQPTGLQGLAGESLPRGLHFHCGQWPQWGWIQQPKSHWKGIWENFLGFEISLCCGGGGGGALLPNPPPPTPRLLVIFQHVLFGSGFLRTFRILVVEGGGVTVSTFEVVLTEENIFNVFGWSCLLQCLLELKPPGCYLDRAQDQDEFWEI